jgi:hypothetical protein
MSFQVDLQSSGLSGLSMGVIFGDLTEGFGQRVVFRSYYSSSSLRSSTRPFLPTPHLVPFLRLPYTATPSELERKATCVMKVQ